MPLWLVLARPPSELHEQSSSARYCRNGGTVTGGSCHRLPDDCVASDILRASASRILAASAWLPVFHHECQATVGPSRQFSFHAERRRRRTAIARHLSMESWLCGPWNDQGTVPGVLAV